MEPRIPDGPRGIYCGCCGALVVADSMSRERAKQLYGAHCPYCRSNPGNATMLADYCKEHGGDCFVVKEA